MKRAWAWSDGLNSVEQLVLEIAANMCIPAGRMTAGALKFLDSINTEHLHAFLADNAFIINRKGMDTDMMSQVVTTAFDDAPGIREAAGMMEEKEYEVILPYLERMEEITGWDSLARCFFDLCQGTDICICPKKSCQETGEATNQEEVWFCGHDAQRRAALAAEIEINRRYMQYRADGGLTIECLEYLRIESNKAITAALRRGTIMPDTVKKPVLDEEEKLLIGQKLGAILRHFQSQGDTGVKATVTVFEKQSKGSVKGIISTITGNVESIDIIQGRIVVDGRRIRLGDIIALEIPPELEDYDEYTDADDDSDWYEPDDWAEPRFRNTPDGWNTSDWSEAYYEDEEADDFMDSKWSAAGAALHRKKSGRIRKPY